MQTYLQTLNRDAFCLLVERITDYAQLARFIDSLPEQQRQLALNCVRSIQSNSDSNVLYTADTLFNFPRLEEWRLELDFRVSPKRPPVREVYTSNLSSIGGFGMGGTLSVIDAPPVPQIDEERRNLLRRQFEALAGHPTLRVFRASLDTGLVDDFYPDSYLREFIESYCEGSFDFPSGRVHIQRDLNNVKMRFEMDDMFLQITGDRVATTLIENIFMEDSIMRLGQVLQRFGSLRKLWVPVALPRSFHLPVKFAHLFPTQHGIWGDGMDNFLSEVKPKRLQLHLRPSEDKVKLRRDLDNLYFNLHRLQASSVEELLIPLWSKEDRDPTSIFRAFPNVEEFHFVYSSETANEIRAAADRAGRRIQFWRVPGSEEGTEIPEWPLERYIDAVDF